MPRNAPVRSLRIRFLCWLEGVSSLLRVCNTDGPPCRRPRKPPNLSHWQREISHRWVGVHRMSIIGEILAKCFAIGIACAGAFVIATFALNNNWL